MSLIVIQVKEKICDLIFPKKNILIISILSVRIYRRAMYIKLLIA
ncbi:hypothetical protein ASZ90_006135 [hydrocarbon metagenome]|uniref:Uncharacterized protein n=1 Tax=hydrocarbon metagenome TaxID=938273 RepID=A0A0W8FTG6_9ZZZZ